MEEILLEIFQLSNIHYKMQTVDVMYEICLNASLVALQALFSIRDFFVCIPESGSRMRQKICDNVCAVYYRRVPDGVGSVEISGKLYFLILGQFVVSMYIYRFVVDRNQFNATSIRVDFNSTPLKRGLFYDNRMVFYITMTIPPVPFERDGRIVYVWRKCMNSVFAS